MWSASQLMARRRSRRRREEGRVGAAKWEKGVQLLHSHACQPSNPDRPFRSEISTLKTFRFPRTDSTLLQATGAAKIGCLTLGFWAGRPRSACRAVLSVACCVLRAATFSAIRRFQAFPARRRSLEAGAFLGSLAAVMMGARPRVRRPTALGRRRTTCPGATSRDHRILAARYGAASCRSAIS